MAVIKFTNSKSSLKKIAEYITQAEKTEARLISGKDCMPESAYSEMMLVKNMFGKNHGRSYIHLVQAFDVKDPVDHGKAHSIGLQLAEYFQGFQILLATHKDRKHIHNHLLINSVNFETGLKFQQSKKEMEKVKDFSDRLCREAGLGVITEKGHEYLSQPEYQAAQKGESWKWRLIGIIEDALDKTATKEEFLQFMELHGYGVKWTDSRKNITYTTPEGFKCRDDKLHERKYIKEEMEYAFKVRSTDREKPERGREPNKYSNRGSGKINEGDKYYGSQSRVRSGQRKPSVKRDRGLDR